MGSARRYLINGLLLSAVTVGLRAVAVSFNAYITRKLGSEAVGLFTLVMSVYSLSVTFASSAVNLAAVRLTSETLARLEAAGASPETVKSALRREMRGCICYSLFFGLLTGAVVFILSPVIGICLLSDERTVMSLRLLSVSLPAIALASALSGYFTGVRKVYKNALTAILEQLAKIFLISLGLVLFAPRGIEYAAAAVVGGGALAEGASLAVSFVLYAFDRVKALGKKKLDVPGGGALSRAAHIALPVAVGSYVRQGLVCAEHIAIPKGLKKSGSGASEALSSYGVLHGMVFPLIFFPASVLSAFASLLVPELSRCLATNDKEHARAITVKVIKTCLVFSVAVSVFFSAFSHVFGMSVYDSPAAGRYIAAIAPLIPVMYLDTSIDAILKGLGQQVYNMKVNITDALISLVLVLVLVPAFGLAGYIVSVYITESVNCALSLSRLIAVTGVRIKPGWLIRPGAAAAVACFGARAVFTLPPFAASPNAAQTVLAVLLTVIMMCLLRAVTASDLSYFKNTVISKK